MALAKRIAALGTRMDSARGAIQLKLKKEREHAYLLCFRTSVNFLTEICVEYVIATVGTLSTDDDEPRGRRPEVKLPLTALLRTLDSSSA